MQYLSLLLVEGVFGYLLQAASFIIGMHAFANQAITLPRYIFVSTLCALLTFSIRASGFFNFGVHTMLVLLMVNICCIYICKTDIRPTVLGSIVMMLLVLATELINLGILALSYLMEEIALRLEDPFFKAKSAIPGNVVLLILAGGAYKLRVGKLSKDPKS